MTEQIPIELRALKRMAPTTRVDFVEVAREIVRLWDKNYGSATLRGGYLTLVTGGWSENEYTLRFIPAMFTMCCWEKSVRGGLHVYRIPRMGGAS